MRLADDDAADMHPTQPPPQQQSAFVAFLRRIAVYVVMIGCQLVFGGYSVVSKIALTDDVDPIIFAFIRDLVASPILLLGAWYFERLPFPDPEDRVMFILLGLLGIYGNQLFFILGLDYTTSVNASLIQPSIPVFTTILAVILGMEALRLRTLRGALKIIGILATVGGAIVVVVLSAGSSDESSNIVLGNLCLVTNCLCTAVFVILQKQVLVKYPPITTTAYSYTIGCFCLFLSVIGGQGHPDRWKLPVSAILPLAYAAILSSVICYSLITWANKHTSPTIVTSFYPLQVVASAVLSAIVLQTVLTLAEILGGLLVILGLFCVIGSKMLEERALGGAAAGSGGPAPATVNAKAVNINGDEPVSEKAPLLGPSGGGVHKYD